MNRQTMKISERMKDEESRQLFNCRYRYYESGNDDYLWDELNVHFDKHPSVFSRWLRSGGSASITAFAAGFNASQLVPLLDRYGMKLDAICDSDVNKQGCDFFGLTIISPEELVAKWSNATIIITTLLKRVSREIYDYLGRCGCGANVIFLIDNDDKQYFPAFIKPTEHEVFIDGGACDGESTVDFYEFAASSESIKSYLFEPAPKWCEVAGANLARHGITATVLEMGLWDKKDTLRFSQNLISRGESRITSDGEMEITAVPLDTVVPENEIITFIKMDIEGAELNALKGAKNHIQRDKPRLAICVYHKKNDIIEIPEYILSIQPDYDFYIRHHTPFAGLETVLYAIPRNRGS